MKRDLPNRQFAQDMLRINVEKDYAIHSIQRQEAVFRRRYCHLISRVENMGKTNPYKGRPPSTVPPQRRKSDPGPSNQTTSRISRKIGRCRAASLPDLRRSSMTTPQAKTTADMLRRKSSPKGLDLPSNTSAKRYVEKPVSKGKRVSISENKLLDSPHTVSSRSPVTPSMENETATEHDPGVKAVMIIGGTSGVASEESTVNANKRESQEKNVRDSAPEDDRSRSVNKYSVESELPWSNTTQNKVFVDYGPTTIDKIFNVLFDPEVDHTTEAYNDSDASEVKSEKRYDRSQEDGSFRRKFSLKNNHLNNLACKMRQTDTRHDYITSMTGEIDNSMESLKKCRYLRLPAQQYRHENGTEDEKLTVWRY